MAETDPSKPPNPFWSTRRQAGRSRGSLARASLMLDINRLLRQRNILPGGNVDGIFTWTYVHSGEKRTSIGYETSLIDPASAWVRLHYTAKDKPKDYRVRLETTPCHHGGFRWWWICPISGRRAAKLYLPPGATVFAARQTYPLAYRSQREAPIDRTHARQARLYRKLGGGSDDLDQPLPPRPRGMHQATYDRLTTDLYAAMDAYDEQIIAAAAAILGRAKMPKSGSGRLV